MCARCTIIEERLNYGNNDDDDIVCTRVSSAVFFPFENKRREERCSRRVTKEGKEKMVVERAHNSDDLPSSLISYMYIRINLQRNRHTMDADRHLSASLSLSIHFFSISSTRRYFQFCLYALHRAPLHLLPALSLSALVTP